MCGDDFVNLVYRVQLRFVCVRVRVCVCVCVSGVCARTGLAEKCLAAFMHPLPATLLAEALQVLTCLPGANVRCYWYQTLLVQSYKY